MQEFLCADCIAAMPLAKFAIVAIAALAASAFGLYQCSRSFITSRLIGDIPTSRIRSASQGYVELVGLAADRGEPQPAPLTGRPCLWWRYTIERYESSGKSHSWKTIEKGHSKTPFYLDDGTGLCRIEPNGAEVSCLHRKVWRGSQRHPLTATVKKTTGLLAGFGNLSFGHSYRYTEYLIRVDDPLYVLGHFESDSTGQRLLTVDQVAGQVIREWKQDFDKLLIRFDDNGNGVLDPGEWAQVQQTARDEARQRQQTPSPETRDHSIRLPEEKGLPFIIGSHAQEQLIRKYSWRAAGFGVLFLAAGAASTWLLSSRFIY